MANIYIDITQIKNNLVWSEGYDNTQDTWVEANLLAKYQYYLDASDNKYIEIFKRMEIAEADVKTYASGEMTETAKELIVSYSYYRFFRDYPVVFVEVDQEKKYKKIFDDLYNNLLDSDVTGVIPSDDDNVEIWMDRL